MHISLSSVKKIFRRVLDGPYATTKPNEAGAIERLRVAGVVKVKTETRWEIQHRGKKMQRIELTRTTATLKPGKEGWLGEQQAKEDAIKEQIRSNYLLGAR